MLTTQSSGAQTGRRDDGFTMMEVMVSLAILAVATTALAALFINTLGVTKSNTNRTTAANLATQQMEKVRGMRALDIPDGRTVLPAVTLGGTTYTITLDSQYVTQNSTGSACNGPNAALPFKRVTATVEWPNMGSIKPVRSDTLRAVGLGDDGFSASKGAVAVAVQDAGANGVAGVPVTVKSASGVVQGTQTTGADGCVVFVELTPGNYIASVNSTGYVGMEGVQQYALGFGVQASQVSKTTLPYDRPGALKASAQGPAGYTVPAGLGYTMTTSVWTQMPVRRYPDCSTAGASAPACFTGDSPATTSSLFPGAYGVWAGLCADAVPAATPILSNVPAQGSATAVAANLQGVDVTTTKAGTLYAVHAADSTCPAGQVVTVGSVGVGKSKVALPYGTWSLQLSPTGSPGGQSVTLTEAQTTSSPVTVSR